MCDLVNLMQTCVISMGVASATPILDNPKKQTIINNYNLTLQKTNSVTSNTNNVIINNSGTLDTGTISDIKVNLTASSNYINVLGNEYTTKVYYGNIGNTLLYRSEEFKNTIYKNTSYSSTSLSYVLKVTPYNYNVDTETQTVLQINMDDFSFDSQTEIVINSAYLRRTLYMTTQSNWDTYINKQLVTDTNKAIISDIEDVNNNYYYQKDVTDINISDWNNYRSLTDDVPITIVPKIDNYIVINYVPIVQAYNNDDPQQPWDLTNTYVTNGYLSTGNISISGTNIIPDSTYEVIDIPGLMWEILTMPFAFVSQAFNLTLFPGTPYQVNISNLFLSIIAVIVFVWLISFFLKLKG